MSARLAHKNFVEGEGFDQMVGTAPVAAEEDSQAGVPDADTEVSSGAW